MTYISLAAHNNELIIINDMGVFTAHFCYSKKQRQGTVDIPAPATEISDGAETPIPRFEIDDGEIPDEDDL